MGKRRTARGGQAQQQAKAFRSSPLRAGGMSAIRGGVFREWRGRLRRHAVHRRFLRHIFQRVAGICQHDAGTAGRMRMARPPVPSLPRDVLPAGEGALSVTEIARRGGKEGWTILTRCGKEAKVSLLPRDRDTGEPLQL